MSENKIKEKKNKDSRLLKVGARISEAFGNPPGREIATKTGASESAVSKWKRGEALLLDNLYKISDLTGYSIHYLLTGNGPKKVETESGYKVELTDREWAEVERLAGENGFTVDELLRRLIVGAIASIDVGIGPSPDSKVASIVAEIIIDFKDKKRTNKKRRQG